MNHIEALKLALEALAASDDFLFNYHDCEPNNEREMDAYSEIRANNHEAITAIKQALNDAPHLAAPVQEPVAWIRWEWNRSGLKSLVFSKPDELPLAEEATGVVYVPLYTTPRTAQPAPVQETVSNVEALRHSANEWADMAVNGLQWVRNIAEGISIPQDALSNLEANLAHCRKVNDNHDVQTLVQTFTPPAAQRQWVGLTDEEIEVKFKQCGGKWNGDRWVIEDADLHPFVRSIESPDIKTLKAISDEYNAWIRHHAAGHSYDDFLQAKLREKNGGAA